MEKATVWIINSHNYNNDGFNLWGKRCANAAHWLLLGLRRFFSFCLYLQCWRSCQCERNIFSLQTMSKTDFNLAWLGLAWLLIGVVGKSHVEIIFFDVHNSLIKLGLLLAVDICWSEKSLRKRKYAVLTHCGNRSNAFSKHRYDRRLHAMN